MGWLEIVIAVGAVAGAIGGFVSLLKWQQAKKAGRTEAKLKAMEREAERAKGRARIDAKVRSTPDDDVRKQLLRDWNRD